MRLLLFIASITTTLFANSQNAKSDMQDKKNMKITEEQWKQELSPEEYNVLRNCGTEPPFTGKYYKHNDKGTYNCAACGAELFSSETKYDSGSGWPSFYNVVNKKAIKEVLDDSFGMQRIEVKCANCDSHLGHLFPDGPKPTGLRYCVNSISLDFDGDSLRKGE